MSLRLLVLCCALQVYCGTTLSHPSEASRKLKYLKSSLLDDFQPSLDKHEVGMSKACMAPAAATAFVLQCFEAQSEFESWPHKTRHCPCLGSIHILKAIKFAINNESQLLSRTITMKQAKQFIALTGMQKERPMPCYSCEFYIPGTMISALICAVLALWCCSLLFSLGVWLYLRIAKVPVYNIEFSAFYVRLDFVQVGPHFPFETNRSSGPGKV